MNHSVRPLPALRCLLAASFLMAASAQAAPTADLTIIGRITPPSCNLELAGGGILNFGEHAFNSLAHDGTKLDSKTIGLNITCNGKTRVGLHVVDNRASSKVLKASLNINAWGSNNATIGDPFIFGLGSVAGPDDTQIPIGGYMFGFKEGDVQADDSKATVLFSADKRAWSAEAIQRQFISPNYTYAFFLGSPGAGATPAAIASVAGSLTVTPTINRAAALPTSTAIDLNGSATISLVYL
jgi:type 1 fimbria pilin